MATFSYQSWIVCENTYTKRTILGKRVCVWGGGGEGGGCVHTHAYRAVQNHVAFPHPPFKSKPHVFNDIIFVIVYMVEITLIVCYALHGLKAHSVLCPPWAESRFKLCHRILKHVLFHQENCDRKACSTDCRPISADWWKGWLKWKKVIQRWQTLQFKWDSCSLICFRGIKSKLTAMARRNS